MYRAAIVPRNSIVPGFGLSLGFTLFYSVARSC